MSRLPDSSPKLRSVADASDYTGLSERQLRELIYKRKIPVVKVGYRVYLRTVDLDKLVARGVPL